MASAGDSLSVGSSSRRRRPMMKHRWPDPANFDPEPEFDPHFVIEKVCVECGTPAEELFHETARTFKLSKCKTCSFPADHFVEWEPGHVCMEAALLSFPACRHLVFNEERFTLRVIAICILATFICETTYMLSLNPMMYSCEAGMSEKFISANTQTARLGADGVPRKVDILALYRDGAFSRVFTAGCFVGLKLLSFLLWPALFKMVYNRRLRDRKKHPVANIAWWRAFALARFPQLLSLIPIIWGVHYPAVVIGVLVCVYSRQAFRAVSGFSIWWCTMASALLYTPTALLEYLFLRDCGFYLPEIKELGETATSVLLNETMVMGIVGS